MQISNFVSPTSILKVAITHAKGQSSTVIFGAQTDQVDFSEAKADPAVLQSHVVQLAQLDRTFFNPQGLDIAADYIKTQWENMGLSVKEQTFIVKGKTYKNVMVSLGPEDADRLVVGAHYDVCAMELNVNSFEHASVPEQIALAIKKIPLKGQIRNDMPGADDNASGVAGLLELTRLLQQQQGRLKKRIDLVAFTLEEPPNFTTLNMGSAHHARMTAQEVAQTNRKIDGMIALDMIGYFKEESGTQKFPFGFFKAIYGNKGNFLAVISDWSSQAFRKQVQSSMERQSEFLPVKGLSAPRSLPGIDYSDHYHYLEMGVPAVLLTDTAYNRNPNYHRHTDTPDTLNYEKMSQVVDGLARTVVTLSA